MILVRRRVCADVPLLSGISCCLLCVSSYFWQLHFLSRSSSKLFKSLNLEFFWNSVRFSSKLYQQADFQVLYVSHLSPASPWDIFSSHSQASYARWPLSLVRMFSFPLVNLFLLCSICCRTGHFGPVSLSLCLIFSPFSLSLLPFFPLSFTPHLSAEGWSIW